MKLLVTILSTEKYFETRVKYVKESWLKDFSYYIILSDHEDKSSNVVKITDDNSYESAVEKNLKSFSYIYDNYSNFDWFLNVDDDSFVNYKNLMELISTLPIDKVVKVGHLNNGTAGFGINYHSGGAGTLFNKEALKILKKITDTNKYDYYRDEFESYTATQTPFADANVGIFCNDNNLTQVHCPLFNPEKPTFHNYTNDEIRKQITFHYIYGEEQVKLYNFIKNI